jgi:hypothetical protein
MVDHDPTDLGLSPHLSDDDLAAIRRARRLGLTAADVPSGPPASPESAARVIDRTTAQMGWQRGRSNRQLRQPCRHCNAAAGQWCRRSVRTGRVFGFEHPGRDSAES